VFEGIQRERGTEKGREREKERKRSMVHKVRTGYVRDSAHRQITTTEEEEEEEEKQKHPTVSIRISGNGCRYIHYTHHHITTQESGIPRGTTSNK